MSARTVLPTIILGYDRQEDLVDVSFPGPSTHLVTPEQINRHFDAVRDWWRLECGRKTAWLIDYAHFAVNLKENELYGRRIAELLDYGANMIVRYGGDSLQRTAVRLYSIRIHSTSNLYENREQALEVLRSVRAGRVQLQAPDDRSGPIKK